MKTYAIKMTAEQNGMPGEVHLEVYGPNDRLWFTLNYTEARCPRTVDWAKAFEKRMMSFLEQE